MPKEPRAVLDLTSFSNAIAQLELALDDIARYPEIETIRAGVIQCFEFTYDLCPKILRRFFAETEGSAAQIDQEPVPNLIRLASVRGLTLNGWDTWSEYRNARNITGHTYDRQKALEVFAIIPAFLDESRHLRNRMEQRLRA